MSSDLPSSAQRKADLERLLKMREAASTPPTTAPGPAKANSRQHRDAFFAKYDRDDDTMNAVASIVGGVLTAAVLWHYGSLALGLVVGLLWGGLVYAVAGWKRRNDVANGIAIGRNPPFAVYHHLVYALCMPRNPKPPPDNPEQFKHFTDLAREIGAEADPETFDRVLDKVARSPKPRPGQSGNARGSKKTRDQSR